MQLPNNSIGVSDILNHDECARRFAYGMLRHTEGGEPPEADNWTNAYGSAFHEMVAYAARTLCSDEEAIQYAFDCKYGRWLGPEEQERLKLDLSTYRQRDYAGVRVISIEQDKRVPLFVHEGQQIYYRFKLDRLYEQLDRPGHFIHVDYKTSRWPKTKQEVDEDVQMSSYNWAIHELYPEIEDLVQLYDQLSYGRVPTRRTAAQRAQTKEWLTHKAKAILADEALEPTLNDWCAYCPLMMDCPVITKLTSYALSEIVGLMPEPGEMADPDMISAYVEQLDTVTAARKILERYEDRVKGTLRRMPADRLARLGYERRQQKVSEWTPEGLMAVLTTIGPERFTELVSLTKTSVEKLEPEMREQIERYLTSRQGAPRLHSRRGPSS